MYPNSQRDYLVTVFCRPCIGIVIKHKSDPSKNPIIMGHQDVVTAPDNLVNAIKSSGIKEADLQLTFYSDIKKNWSEKNVNVGGDGSIMKSWAELYGTESQKEAFDNCVSFYAKIFPKADINKILNPFDHPTSQLKRHAFIDTTLAIGKDGSIFTFSPLVASICGINDGEGRIDIDRNSTENREDLLTDILQKRFCDAFIAESTNRFLEFNKHKNQMIPFVQVYITQPRK